MKETPQTPLCPRCDTPMSKWRVPEDSGWNGEFHWVCFNDECPYYVRGWEHMKATQKVVASYRLKLDPETGSTSPLGVWSPAALKDLIMDGEKE